VRRAAHAQARRGAAVRRGLVALGAVVLGGALFATPALTDASWVDSERAEYAMTALKVPAPVFDPTCTLSPGLLGLDPVGTIVWTVPTGYTIANIKFGTYNATTMLWEDATGSSNVVTTGTAPNYTTKFSGGLLSGLLGGQKTVGMYTLHPSGWASGWQSIFAKMELLGINPTCAVNPPPA